MILITTQVIARNQEVQRLNNAIREHNVMMKADVLEMKKNLQQTRAIRNKHFPLKSSLIAKPTHHIICEKSHQSSKQKPYTQVSNVS